MLKNDNVRMSAIKENDFFFIYKYAYNIRC